MVTLTLDARPDLAPGSLLVLMTTRAFVRQILTARPAVKPARRYQLTVRFNMFHIHKATELLRDFNG